MLKPSILPYAQNTISLWCKMVYNTPQQNENNSNTAGYCLEECRFEY